MYILTIYAGQTVHHIETAYSKERLERLAEQLLDCDGYLTGYTIQGQA
jgi:aerobic-type carbon monoxide dehydrogenase small subunit (CoxS/CutS family)